MLRRRQMAWLGLWLFGGSSLAARAEDGLFRDLSIEKAMASASEEKKSFLLIDFYTVWCGPCKKLDETTWKNQAVRDWLNHEAVSIKVDAEKNEALAEKYRINIYPTLLMIRPDGTEIDRLVGYRDASTFLEDARESLAGNDSLARIRKTLTGRSANDPMLRMNLGDALAQKGRSEDALSEYLWCFDHGLEHGPGFTGVRLSFLLSKIVELGKTNPEAIPELRKRRDAATRTVETGKVDFSVLMGCTSLNSYLGEPEQTLALYERTKGNADLPDYYREFLLEQSVDFLLKARRYKEVVDGIKVEKKLGQAIANYQRSLPFMPNDPDVRSTMKQNVVSTGARYYEAQLGSKEIPGAARTAATLVKFDPENAYPALIAAAQRVGDPETVARLTEEARKALKTGPDL